MLKFFRWSLRHSVSSLLVSASPTNLPFLFSSYLTLVLSLPPYPPPFLLLPQSLWQEPSPLSPPVPSNYNGSPDTRFSRGTTQLISWPDVERYLRPLQSLVVSLLSLVSTPLFSDWRRSVSSKFFDTGPSISTEELVLPRHTRFVSFSFTLQRTQPSVKLLSLSRIDRIENPFCSACYALWRLSVSTICGPGPGSCPASGAPWSSVMPPFLGRGRVTTTLFIVFVLSCWGQRGERHDTVFSL